MSIIDKFFLALIRNLDRLEARILRNRLPDLVDCETRVFKFPR